MIVDDFLRMRRKSSTIMKAGLAGGATRADRAGPASSAQHLGDLAGALPIAQATTASSDAARPAVGLSGQPLRRLRARGRTRRPRRARGGRSLAGDGGMAGPAEPSARQGVGYGPQASGGRPRGRAATDRAAAGPAGELRLTGRAQAGSGSAVLPRHPDEQIVGRLLADRDPHPLAGERADAQAGLAASVGEVRRAPARPRSPRT